MNNVGTGVHLKEIFISNDAMQPLICNATTYMPNSTGSFANEISSFDFRHSHILVSYDVVSLFTNIPLNESMEIVCNHVYVLHIPTTLPPNYS